MALTVGTAQLWLWPHGVRIPHRLWVRLSFAGLRPRGVQVLLVRRKGGNAKEGEQSPIDCYQHIRPLCHLGMDWLD